MSTKETLPMMSEDATRKLLIELVNAGFDCGAYPEEDILKSDAYEKLRAKSRQLTDKVHALITSLRTRLDAAEEERDEIKALFDNKGYGVTTAQAMASFQLQEELKQAREANAELVKDKERLDKWQKFVGSVESWPINDGEINFNIHDRLDNLLSENTDLRQAIDAATTKGTQ